MFSKSPNFARKGGHQQLNQDGVDDEDKIIAGVEFSVQYMGSIEVSSGCGTGSEKTDVPVAQVMTQNKTKSDDKKSKKMKMTVTHKNLSVMEENTGALVASFPISKVTYCNVDGTYEKAFVFVARERKEKPFKAYVFLCNSKSKAQEVFKAVSLAFKMNYESYQATSIREASLRSFARDGNYSDEEEGIAGLRAETNNNNEWNYANEQGEVNRPCSPKNGVRNITPTTREQNFLRPVDRRLESLQNSRIRSNTAPIVNTAVANDPGDSTTNNDDDFDEFTQLAKSRSKTVDSQQQNIQTTSSQRWDSDPSIFSLRIH
ncbi:low density lipoprotein receptor adapter protein 1-A-like [Actinia tenebrosa]|uniref:Low density lipoprotein receptor adapter protein 1-A-like n=1 Tax=Actinia tenebrosa TaxID=6105 RepID=A0A6P8HG10_ACTTE|nr:low density lipoprotein receptor adapter protein 1-A-like [Actinia tenebrosa]